VSTMVGSPLGVAIRVRLPCTFVRKVVQAIRIYPCFRPNPRRYPPRQHRCRDCVATDMTSAQLTLAPRIRAAAGPSWLDSRNGWLASHKNVVRCCAVATRLRYDEPGGRGLVSPLRLAPPLIPARRSCHPKQCRPSREARRWQNGADSPGSDRRSSSEAEPDPSAKRSDTSDTERR
jgi:hypothetical protein